MEKLNRRKTIYYDETEKEEIRKLLEQGLKCPIIAKKLNRHTWSVRRFAQRNNLFPKTETNAKQDIIKHVIINEKDDVEVKMTNDDELSLVQRIENLEMQVEILIDFINNLKK